MEASTMQNFKIILALVIIVADTQAATYPDCIAEKFYRFSEDHTACVLPSADATTSGVSSADKTAIVDKHNELRRLQSATDMQEMVWDDEIAAIAQRWSDNCDFSHDAVRSIPGRFSVGQNLGAGHSDWESVVQAWYDEISDFTYGNQGANSFSAVGHYTQLVWAKSSKIGCGYTYCENLSYKRFYACNYGPAGNLNWWTPYAQGSKCGDCPNSCTDDLCDCGGKVCENGGTLDLDTCECSCLKSWHLPDNCALNCTGVNEASACNAGGVFYEKCQVYSNVPYECPTHCNICPYSGVDYESSGGGTEQGNGETTPSSAHHISVSLMVTFSAVLAICM